MGLQTELFLGRVQADKCLESAPARSQLCRQLVEIGLLGYIFGQQLLECVFEPRIRYDTRSFDVVDLSADDRDYINEGEPNGDYSAEGSLPLE